MESKRVFNFSAGPCCLPLEILKKAQDDLLNFQGTGMSIMEISHRNKAYAKVWNDARNGLRKLLGIPEEYQVFFMQGGASLQFSAIPMNFLNGKTVANYLPTGVWSQKAISDAGAYCKTNIVWENPPKQFFNIASSDKWKIDPEGAYFHYCSNETINGLTFFDFPYSAIPEGMPLVADMSSEFCSRPIDVKKYGIIYAGAQKNCGPAGNTVIIVRKDLIKKDKILKITPPVINFDTVNSSPEQMYNTPTTWSCYMTGLYVEYMNKFGLKHFEDLAIRRSKMLYDTIDSSGGYYINKIEPAFRSRMNIPFQMAKGEATEKKFFAEAEKAGLIDLSGHRSVGGLRASMYNAMPIEGTEALVNFMKKFKDENPM